MKKSLLVTLEFPPFKGGVGNYLYNLANNFPPDSITVLTEKTANLPPSTPYRLYHKKLLSKFIWPRWIFLPWIVWRIVKKEKIDLLQIGQILPLGTVALLLKKIFNLPYLVYTYGMDLTLPQISRRKTALIKKILKNADLIITISQYTKNELIKLGVNERKITTVYPCAHIQENNIQPLAINEFIEKNRLENKKILLTIGRLVRRKGHDMVIRSLPKILENEPDLIYLIIGQGPELNNLRSLVDELKLADKVKFIEHTTDEELPLYFCICEIFIMPSREEVDNKTSAKDVEGFGIVFLEANLFSKPVIGGFSGGQSDAIADGISGLLVDPKNIDEITQAIAKLLNDPAYAQKLGKQGKDRALISFQWPKEVEKIKKLLK